MEKTITLDTPIVRGETKIDIITLRKPHSRQLSGCSLTSLLHMEVDTLIKVLPRITEPALTAAEVGKLDPADMLQLGGEVADFLLPKRVKQDASPSE